LALFALLLLFAPDAVTFRALFALVELAERIDVEAA
jgi:hypothetical protein